MTLIGSEKVPRRRELKGNGWIRLKTVTNKFSAQKNQYKGHFRQNKFFRVNYKGNKVFYKENQQEICAFSEMQILGGLMEVNEGETVY